MSWYRGDYGYGGFAPYVSVATRQRNATKHAQKLAQKEGRATMPVKITGRAMATTYWGKAWCDNLTAYSDFSNRLPRGRTYARNGSVVDLQIKKGSIDAIVAGSEVYTISISITVLAPSLWTRLKADCAQSITSLIDLLQGRFDAGVMQRLAHPTEGLFPRPKEIKMRCSCPDSAGLCKHLAAVLYGVGNRLDTSPEMLFTLRNVDHLELVSQAVAEGNLDRTLSSEGDDALAGSDLGAIFGIELDQSQPPPKRIPSAKKAVTKKQKAGKLAARQTKRKTGTKSKPAPAKSSGAVKTRAAAKGKPGKAAAAGGAVARRKAR